MDDSGAYEVVMLLVAAAAAPVMVVWERHLSRRRRARIASWAAQRGWNFVARDPRWEHVLPGFPFGTGFRWRARNVVSGPFGRYPAAAFEYSYQGERRNDGMIPQRFGVHVLRLPAPLPWLHLSAERFADRAAKLFGAQDLDFESEDFNRLYRVRAIDPRLASDIVNPRTMELLIEVGGPDVRIHGWNIALVTPGRLDLEVVEGALTVLANVCDNVPPFVWRDHGGAAPLAPGARS